MKTINRTVIVVTPKKPYVDWADSFDDGGVELDSNVMHNTAYLIPDEYDEYNYELFLRDNFDYIFEEELNAWMTDPDEWPGNRDFETFTDWFDIHACDMAFDQGKERIETEEF